MSRARLAAGLALASLAGWWAARPAVPARLRPAELCRCGHLGNVHDPDLGCTAPAGASWCDCRRLRCRCPLDPARDR